MSLVYLYKQTNTHTYTHVLIQSVTFVVVIWIKFTPNIFLHPCLFVQLQNEFMNKENSFYLCIPMMNQEEKGGNWWKGTHWMQDMCLNFTLVYFASLTSESITHSFKLTRKISTLIAEVSLKNQQLLMRLKGFSVTVRILKKLNGEWKKERLVFVKDFLFLYITLSVRVLFL